MLMNPGVGWINLFTCCNQSISVIWPLDYIRWKLKYVYVVPAVSIVFTISTYVWAIVANFPTKDELEVIKKVAIKKIVC